MRPRYAVRPMVMALALGVAIGPGTGPNVAGAAQTGPGGLGAGRFVPGEVVIQYQPGTGETEKASARGAIGARLKQRTSPPGSGDLELTTLPPGLAVADAVRNVRAHPAVAFVEPNFLYAPAAETDDPYYTNGSLWGLYGDATTPENVYGSQAGEAWAKGYTGDQSVHVAVIDHGIDFSHPDLAPNIWTNPYDSDVGPSRGINDDQNCSTSNRIKVDASGKEYVDPDTNFDAGGYIDDVHGWSFVDDNNQVYVPGSSDATDGHGTHVAGTIGAVGHNAAGVAGVNWAVTIIPIR